MSKKKKKTPENSIAQNKKAWHDFHIDTKFEAGMTLMGWEVKSIREGKVQLRDSYVLLKDNEAWLVGAHISPLITASTHVICNPTRSRKLLLNRREIDRLFEAKNQKGYTIVAISMYWKKQFVKCQIAMVKGKKLHDKRADSKERDWNREKSRVLKADNR